MVVSNTQKKGGKPHGKHNIRYAHPKPHRTTHKQPTQINTTTKNPKQPKIIRTRTNTRRRIIQTTNPKQIKKNGDHIQWK